MLMPMLSEKDALLYDECVILKSMPYKESDRLVTVFSKNFGKKNLLAKGACKPGSKIGGFTDSLSIINYGAKPTRSFTLLTQPKIISALFHIKEMGPSFYKAYAMCELILRASEFDAKMPLIYDTLKNSLIIMDLLPSDDETGPAKVSIKFQLFWLKYTGFMFNFENCLNCGLKLGDNYSYDYSYGGNICYRCCIGRSDIMEIKPYIKAIIDISTEPNLKIIIETAYTKNALGFISELIKRHIKANLNIVLASDAMNGPI